MNSYFASTSIQQKALGKADKTTSPYRAALLELSMDSDRWTSDFSSYSPLESNHEGFATGKHWKVESASARTTDMPLEQAIPHQVHHCRTRKRSAWPSNICWGTLLICFWVGPWCALRCPCYHLPWALCAPPMPWELPLCLTALCLGWVSPTSHTN